MQNRFLENLNIKILIISLSIFFFKWFFSYYIYGAENIFIKFLLNLNIVISNEEEKKTSSVPLDKKKVVRNEKCPCGSGKKYKHCCGSV